MINVKNTLKALHQKFPTLSLDDLFTILDCISETPDHNLFNKYDGIKTYFSEPSTILESPQNYVTTVTNSKRISGGNVSHKICGGN